MQQKISTENEFLQRSKPAVPTPIEDPIGRIQAITNEGDLALNKIATEEEIKKRKFLKIVGAKTSEEQNTEKRNFTFNNPFSNASTALPGNTVTSGGLFSNPFIKDNPPQSGLFSNNKSTISASNSNQEKNINEITAEKIQENKADSGTTTEKSIFKNPFITSNPFNNPSGSLFGTLNQTKTGTLFGNTNNNSLFPTASISNSLFGNPTGANLFGNPTFNFNTNQNQKGFESSDEDGSDFEDPEAEVEIKPKNDKKLEEFKVEVNEKILKIPVAEFFIYDFVQKKYNSIGKGDFTIEYSKTDINKQTPLLIFRNSVLKILFQGIFKNGITKLETVKKNFKTISIVQKAFVYNEEAKKFDYKAVKINHVNEMESNTLIEAFAKLEKETSFTSATKAVADTASENKSSTSQSARDCSKKIEENKTESINKKNPINDRQDSQHSQNKKEINKTRPITNIGNDNNTCLKNSTHFKEISTEKEAHKTTEAENINSISNTDKNSVNFEKDKTENNANDSKKNSSTENDLKESQDTEKPSNGIFSKVKLNTVPEVNNSKSQQKFSELVPNKISATSSQESNLFSKNKEIITNQATGSKTSNEEKQANENKTAAKAQTFINPNITPKYESASHQKANLTSTGKVTTISIQLITSKNKSEKHED